MVPMFTCGFVRLKVVHMPRAANPNRAGKGTAAGSSSSTVRNECVQEAPYFKHNGGLQSVARRGDFALSRTDGSHGRNIVTEKPLQISNQRRCQQLVTQASMAKRFRSPIIPDCRHTQPRLTNQPGSTKESHRVCLQLLFPRSSSTNLWQGALGGGQLTQCVNCTSEARRIELDRANV